MWLNSNYNLCYYYINDHLFIMKLNLTSLIQNKYQIIANQKIWFKNVISEVSDGTVPIWATSHGGLYPYYVQPLIYVSIPNGK